MTKNELLETSIIIAISFHLGQVRKGTGYPYITHPLAVMSMVVGIDEKMVAVLHDVIEDTECTLHHLSCCGIPKHIVDAVDAMTKHDKDKETYKEYLGRVKANPIALEVKISDIYHNLSDMTGIDKKTRYNWAVKYNEALGYLEND